MLKIVTVVGARPQFIKAAVVSRAIDEWNSGDRDHSIEECLVHTGQHYDENMSKVFFDELDIRTPSVNLGLGGATHGEMTGRMLAGIEALLRVERPDWVLVYGDTNSTLAAALAAAKLHIPIAHVEAGLRSFNRRMPEEINRVLTDHVSNLLFCPTETAVRNLCREGIIEGVRNVGDVMLDASLHYRTRARITSSILAGLRLKRGQYVLATCHRSENTDDPNRLESILRALDTLALDNAVVFPLHPRTRAMITSFGMGALLSRMKVIEPVSFLDMISLEEGACVIITDSGGVQKESYFFGVPCVTLRDETEWVETVSAGCNQLVGTDRDRIVEAVRGLRTPSDWPDLYGDGRAAQHILSHLTRTEN